MMRSAQYPLRLLDDPELEAQVASFPFKGNTSFLIVLPLPGRENVSSVLPRLNISDLYRRLPQEKTMQVNLPKVKLHYHHELQEALIKMGPNLSGISDLPLKVTGVLHASTEELSEEGAETSMHSVSIFSVNSPFLSSPSWMMPPWSRSSWALTQTPPPTKTPCSMMIPACDGQCRGKRHKQHTQQQVAQEVRVSGRQQAAAMQRPRW